MKRSNFVIAAASIALASGAWMPEAHAADDRSPVIKINEATAKADVHAESLRGNVTVLSGAGGNIVVYDSPEGKFIIDAGIAVSKDKVERALKAISSTPPKYLVNTHYHWDHTDGNVWVHQAGATIIGAPMTARHLAQATRVDDWKFTFEALPPEGRPTIIVKGSKTMRLGAESLTMRSYGNGHTDGDLSVYLHKADILVLGDLFWNPYYPFIDNEHGGSIGNTIAWANSAIKASGEKTIIVPGHGAVGNRADLMAWRNMLTEVRDRVAALKKQGRALPEIVAAKPTAAHDARFGGFVIDGDFFTKLVHDGL